MEKNGEFQFPAGGRYLVKGTEQGNNKTLCGTQTFSYQDSKEYSMNKQHTSDLRHHTRRGKKYKKKKNQQQKNEQKLWFV